MKSFSLFLARSLFPIIIYLLQLPLIYAIYLPNFLRTRRVFLLENIPLTGYKYQARLIIYVCFWKKGKKIFPYETIVFFLFYLYGTFTRNIVFTYENYSLQRFLLNLFVCLLQFYYERLKVKWYWKIGSNQTTKM